MSVATLLSLQTLAVKRSRPVQHKARTARVFSKNRCITLASGIAILALTWLSPVVALSGIVVFGNLGPENNARNDPAYSLADGNSIVIGGYRDYYRTIGFTTGTSPQYLTITSITLELEHQAGDPQAPLPSVELMTTSGTTPSGTAIASWTISSIADSPASYELASPGISLSPSTTYWVVVHDSNALVSQPASLYYWDGFAKIDSQNPGQPLPNPASAQNGSGYTAYMAGYKRDGGAWNLGAYGSFVYSQNIDLGLGLTAQAVPEIDPASGSAVFSLLLGAFGLFERRSRRLTATE